MCSPDQQSGKRSLSEKGPRGRKGAEDKEDGLEMNKQDAPMFDDFEQNDGGGKIGQSAGNNTGKNDS